MLAKSLDILGRYDLRMFDPPAAVAAIAFRQFLDRRKRFGLRGVAERVDRDLLVLHRGTAHQVAQLRLAQQG